MKLYNTLNRKKEQFVPLKKNEVTMYNCGPTVYWDVHTGNLRAYTAWDVLARYIRYKGYKLNRIINFTDIGHMSSDEDFGEDKVESSAKAQKLTPRDISLRYIARILQDFRLIGIQTPSGQDISSLPDVHDITSQEWRKYGFAPATDYIASMIKIIEKIEDNGYTYETKQAVYFDTSKFKDYWKFAGQKLTEKTVADRDEVVFDPEKKNSADFVLWMKATGKYADHIMKWGSDTGDAPLKTRWGVGFPGWHIECTAMSKELLGEKFDIHTGGTDHIPVHHTNEIAQNWGAFGHIGASYWLHNEMVVDKEGKKASKSKKNVYFLNEITEKGFDPMDLRYYFLTVNYRKPMQFSFEGLSGARKSRLKIVKSIMGNKTDFRDTEAREKFEEYMDDNLNTAGALAVLNEIVSNNKCDKDLLKDIDNVLGLRLIESSKEEISKIPDNIEELAKQRAKAKQGKKYDQADKIRQQIEQQGWIIVDEQDGYKIIAKE